MRVLLVANQKGGCAKTTTVVNLAAAFAERALRVLVIDLDAQSNATQWLGVDTAGDGAFKLLTGSEPLETLCHSTRIANVSMIPASQELVNTEQALAGKIAVDSILRRRLAKLQPEQWDYVLIDTPPTLGVVTLNALVAATDLLIPVTTHVMTLAGVARLMERVQEVQELLNPTLNVIGFIASRFDARTRHAKDVFDALKVRFGDQVLKTTIRENVRLAEAPSFSESVLTYDNKGSAAQDYRALAQELIERGL